MPHEPHVDVSELFPLQMGQELVQEPGSVQELQAPVRGQAVVLAAALVAALVAAQAVRLAVRLAEPPA